MSAVTAAADGAASSVTLADGSELRARMGVVVATTRPDAERLLGDRLAKQSPSKDAPPVGTACLYYKCAPTSPHCRR